MTVSIRTLLPAAFALLVLVLAGCSDDATVNAPSEVDPDLIVLDAKVTSVMDPATGEPVALNAPAADPDAVAEGEANRKAGTVTSHSTFYRGRAPYHDVEVDDGWSQDYVLTAVGGRIDKSSTWTTLRLRGQRINADGSLGYESTKYDGTEPYYTPEAYYEVPPGYAIVGVGAREYDRNLTTLHVYYRRYDANTQRLTGSTYLQKVGSNPNHSVEVLFRTNEESVNPGDLETFALTGLAFRSYDDNVTTMRAHVGRIN